MSQFFTESISSTTVETPTSTTGAVSIQDGHTPGSTSNTTADAKKTDSGVESGSSLETSRNGTDDDDIVNTTESSPKPFLPTAMPNVNEGDKTAKEAAVVATTTTATKAEKSTGGEESGPNRSPTDHSSAPKSTAATAQNRSLLDQTDAVLSTGGAAIGEPQGRAFTNFVTAGPPTADATKEEAKGEGATTTIAAPKVMKFDLSDVSFDDQENPGSPTDVEATGQAPTCSHEGATFKVRQIQGGFSYANWFIRRNPIKSCV